MGSSECFSAFLGSGSRRRVEQKAVRSGWRFPYLVLVVSAAEAEGKGERGERYADG